jgi:hypothetical protein
VGHVITPGVIRGYAKREGRNKKGRNMYSENFKRICQAISAPSASL